MLLSAVICLSFLLPPPLPPLGGALEGTSNARGELEVGGQRMAPLICWCFLHYSSARAPHHFNGGRSAAEIKVNDDKRLTRKR